MSSKVRLQSLVCFAATSLFATQSAVAQCAFHSADADCSVAQSLGQRAGTERAAVTFAGFHVFEDGSSRIFLKLTRVVPVEVQRAATVLEYVLRGARVPIRNNTNPLVTKHFSSRIEEAVLVARGNDAVLRITLREPASPKHQTVRHEDGQATLQVDFERPNTRSER